MLHFTVINNKAKLIIWVKSTRMFLNQGRKSQLTIKHLIIHQLF